jgi:hypothetical protein
MGKGQNPRPFKPKAAAPACVMSRGPLRDWRILHLRSLLCNGFSDILAAQGTDERVQSMNLRGVLLPKSCVSALLLVGLCIPASFAQKKEKIEFTEQTSFSSEEEKFEHPVPLNESAKKALASEQSVADVLRDEKLSVETMPDDWFTASEVHLSNLAEADLVVMGAHFARGAYTSTFWVLRKLPGGYRVVLRDNAHDIELEKTRTNGLCNIRSVIVTLRYGTTAEYEFDGKTYRIAKRTSQPNAPEAKVDPTEYKSRREFIQVRGQDPNPILAEARAWIWRHWQDRERTYVRVSTHDDDGEEQDCSYFIDEDSENGEMQVTLKVHRITWDRDSPAGPRYLVTEDDVFVATKVQRIGPPVDDSTPPRVLSGKEELPASNYRLRFIDYWESILTL